MMIMGSELTTSIPLTQNEISHPLIFDLFPLCTLTPKPLIVSILVRRSTYFASWPYKYTPTSWHFLISQSYIIVDYSGREILNMAPPLKKENVLDDITTSAA